MASYQNHLYRNSGKRLHVSTLGDEYGDGRLKIIPTTAFSYQMKGVKRLKELEKVLFRI
jgi:hypothetical protein